LTKPNINLLAVIVAVPVIGMTIISPALTLIKNDLDISFSDTQLVLTLYFIFLALGQILSGPFSDKYGRKPILILGATIYSISAFAASYSSNIEILLILRCIQGFGAAACLSVGRTILSDCFEISEAAKQMSKMTAIMAIIPISCFIFGGFLAEFLGWRINLIALGVISLILIILISLLLQETLLNKAKSVSFKNIFIVYKGLIKNNSFNFFTITTAMQTSMFFAMNGFMPYEFERKGVSISEFGIWFSLTSVGYIFGNIINSKLTPMVGLEKMCFVGTVCSFCTVFIFFLNNNLGENGPLTLSLICVLFGCSNGFAVANSMTGAINSSKLNKGAASGLMGAFQVGSGGLAGFLIIYFGGAENFNICLFALFIMSGISIISSYLVLYRKKIII
jgi:DHA1 family bicyclomycin/chloramphenicol resistance-like MFS transporter|tara:strand:- start:771 stop:1949 length:1179 start_codon:yes stop_codon:yes gene_type:complete